MDFYKGSKYSREQIWKKYHPESGNKPRGGGWDTGYVREGDELIAFLNIGAAGRTGHDFENAYDPESETLTWFGKPKTNSKQPTFKMLLSGALTPHFFARWDNKNTSFTYLGVGTISSFQDEVSIQDGKTAIQLQITLTAPKETIGPSGILDSQGSQIPPFAKKLQVLVNRYERDPSKRALCIDHFGYACQICGFSFTSRYGDVGKDFCHVHHIEPLGEAGGEGDIDPTKDLIPVCANCHAMLHRKSPALKPGDLKELLKSSNSNK